MSATPDDRPFYTSSGYWVGVSQNVVAWTIVIVVVLVIERTIGRRVSELHV